MGIRVLCRTAIAGFVVLALAGCQDDGTAPESLSPEETGLYARPGGETTTGNNLSYPVLWAEGVAKTLQGTPGMTPILTGEYWYQWGTNGVDPDVTPASCPADPDEDDLTVNPNALPLCDNGIPGSVNTSLVAGTDQADNPLPLARAFLQKDAGNVWQAGSRDVSALDVAVDWIDWGDNLESNDWYTRSQVRTEVVLFQDLFDPGVTDPFYPMLEYEMRHTSGWGIDEVHGLAADLNSAPTLGPGNRATVYSHCARLTIQKLRVERTEAQLADLVWVPGSGWTEPEFDPVNPDEPYPHDLINDPIFNKPVWEGGDGPGYYAAEINVKGRIIYGYTWNVRTLNDDGAGDYRLTFSFDAVCGSVLLNTFFVEGVTEIMVPIEEIETEAEPVGGGAVAQLRTDLNLTYIDVRILERGGGGGGGGKKTR